MSKFKAVIFGEFRYDSKLSDLFTNMGGVVLRFADPTLFQSFLNVVENDKEKCERFMDVERGKLCLTDALDIYQIVYPGFKDVKDFENAELEDYSGSKNEDVLQVIRQLKKLGIKVGLLTNNFFWSNKRKRSAIISEAAEFDDVVESCRVGCRKPEREIFEIMADRLGVRLDECIFVDDWKKNVDGAEAAGLAGVFLPNDNTILAIQQLEDLLNVKLYVN